MNRAEFESAATAEAERLRRFVATALSGSTPEEVEELSQAALAAAWQGIDGFAGRSRFSTWLLGIARNLCLAHLRQQRRRALSAELDARPALGRGVLSSVVRRELAERLELSLGRLPQSYREAFVLRYVEGFDAATVGEITGVEAGTVRVRAHRARALLRDELGDVVDTSWQD